jgi:VIT1/CCC1 family predicted Fe2+/Mn2+ transporter
MLSTLEIAAAALFLALAALMMALWTFIAPQLWTELDLRVAMVALSLTWLGVAWALPRGKSISPDPQLP